ncbi:TolC family protein [Serratia sp. DD3]|uniref:TolC family protein n=1 Tax=Serratia sp. DD3 TaxID=1410619 RepID=UPI0003C52605|nr:TolC family protein [Serratia sp. DD3]KEY57386.1 outer membrane channel protein [Serratia sp. DD3]
MAKKQSEFRRLKIAMAIAICLPFSSLAIDQQSSLSGESDNDINSLPPMVTQEEYVEKSNLKPSAPQSVEQVKESGQSGANSQSQFVADGAANATSPSVSSTPSPKLTSNSESSTESSAYPTSVNSQPTQAVNSQAGDVIQGAPQPKVVEPNGVRADAGIKSEMLTDSKQPAQQGTVSQSQKLFQPEPVYDKTRLSAAEIQRASNNAVDNVYAGKGETNSVNSQPTQAANSQSGDVTQGAPQLKVVEPNGVRADADIKSEISTDNKQPAQQGTVSQSKKLFQPEPVYDKTRLSTAEIERASDNAVDNVYAGKGETSSVNSQPTQAANSQAVNSQAVNSQAANSQSGDVTQGEPQSKMVDRNNLRSDAYIKNEITADSKQPEQKSSGDYFPRPLQPDPAYDKVRSNTESNQRDAGNVVDNVYAGKSDASSHTFLRKMVKMALMHSPEVRSSDADVLAAGYYVDQTKGQRWPQVQVGVSTPLATQGGSADLQRNNSNANDTSGNVSVVTPIYDWGKISHQVDSAEEGVTAAVNARSYTKEMLAYNTVSELINLARYQESRVVAVAYMTRMKQLADMLEQITVADQGRASEFTQARAKLLSARANLDDIEHQLSVSRIKLVRLLGVEPNLPENISWQDSMVPASTAIASLAKNPNLLKLQAQTKAAESEADSIKAAGLPQLNLVVSKNTAKDINGNETGWYTGVNVQWNAFSGGSQKAAQQAALAKATGAQQQYETAYRDLEYQINNLVQTRDSSFLRAQDFDRLSIETDRVRQMFYDQWYHLGKRTLLDVLTAENDHFNNQLSAINNRYDGYVANINVIASAAMLLSWLER